MAAFSNIARALTFGLVGGGTKKAGVSAPGPTSGTQITNTQAPLPGPTPPDAGLARANAVTAAQRAAQRQRKRAMGTPSTQTLATGLTATAAPRTLLGY